MFLMGIQHSKKPQIHKGSSWFQDWCPPIQRIQKIPITKTLEKLLIQIKSLKFKMNTNNSI